MQSDGKDYLKKFKDFLSEESISKLKDIVDSAEVKLRGGSVFSDYSNGIKGGLKVCDAGTTTAQVGNIVAWGALGTHALVKALVEWRKGYYFCCV